MGPRAREREAGREQDRGRGRVVERGGPRALRGGPGWRALHWVRPLPVMLLLWL